MQLRIKPSLLHSFGQLNVEVLQTSIYKQPDTIRDPLNQFIRFFHSASGSEQETEPKWTSGLKASFEGEIFEIQRESNDKYSTISYRANNGSLPECEQTVEIEVWAKESRFEAGVIEDMCVGACCISIDQLKVGGGVTEEYALLKDFAVVGKVYVRSQYFREDGPNSEYYNYLAVTQREKADEYDPSIICATTVNHNLKPAYQPQGQNFMTLPIDPYENDIRSM